MFQGDAGLRAAQTGRGLARWLDADTVTASYVVSTNASIYFDIPEGKQVVVKSVVVGCETINEECAIYLVGCSAIAGGGSPTQFSHHFHMTVGDKKEGSVHLHEEFTVPAVIKYSDGHRSVSLAVKATDTATVVTYGWCGWVEDEGTLS